MRDGAGERARNPDGASSQASPTLAPTDCASERQFGVTRDARRRFTRVDGKRDTASVVVPASYPASVRGALARLVSELAGTKAEGLTVYGSLARGTFREGTSDVNLAVVLGDARAETLLELSAPLRAARASVRIEPFLVTRAELPRLCDSFPVKLLDIQRHHHVLCGEDVFASLHLRREDVRLRAEQELRNHQLRLRRAWLFSAAEPAMLAPALRRSASSLLVELETALWLRGTPPSAPTSEAIFSEGAAAFELDADTLRALAHFKLEPERGDARSLFPRVLALVERLAEIVDGLEAR